MRLLRVLAASSVFAALLAQPLAAQDGRQFKDAWFWGIKGGGLVYSSPATSATVAPFVGADWLITRTRGGLYVSYDQAFLSTQSSIADRDPTNLPFTHVVDLNNMRRVSVAGLIFPMQSPHLHPYLGAGFAFSQISSAELVGSGPLVSKNPAAAQDSVQRMRSSFSPHFMGGVQVRMPQFSVFGQVTAAPTQTNFFLSRNPGRAFGFSLEGGIRYNVGSSIDRTR